MKWIKRIIAFIAFAALGSVTGICVAQSWHIDDQDAIIEHYRQKYEAQDETFNKELKKYQEKYATAHAELNLMATDACWFEGLGNFTLTYYGVSDDGMDGKGITASGTHVQQGRTIAADPDIIPSGSEVYIEGYGMFIAEDTGSAIHGNILDVYLDSAEYARTEGRKNARVFIKRTTGMNENKYLTEVE
jgi:3D (Asp-Asp-Asp) domain-containing protein